MKDSIELARLVSADLGQEVTPDEVRTYLLTGAFPGRLEGVDRSDMALTLLKELSA